MIQFTFKGDEYRFSQYEVMGEWVIIFFGSDDFRMIPKVDFDKLITQ